MARLVDYEWPGNIRELQNVIERAVVLCQGPTLELDPDLLPVSAGRQSPADPVPEPAPPRVHRGDGQSGGLEGSPLPTLEEMERTHIEAALRQTGGKVEGVHGAARILGLHPNTLRGRMQKLGIKRRGHDGA
jgi:DNA-binding NtrC family response regulator